MKKNRSKQNKRIQRDKTQIKNKKILPLGLIVAVVFVFCFAAIKFLSKTTTTSDTELASASISTDALQTNSIKEGNTNSSTSLTPGSNTTQIGKTPVLANTTTNQEEIRKIQLRTPEDTASILFHQADVLFNKGLIKESIELYHKALELKPDDEEIHYNVAIAYAAAGDTNMAIHYYKEAIKLVPEFLEARNNLGNLLVKLGKYDEAKEQFLAGLKIMPEDAQLRNSYGTLLGLQGKHKEALEEFKAAVKYDPDYPEARFNLAMALVKAGEYEGAIAQLKQLIEKHPDMTFAEEWIEKIKNIKERKSREPNPISDKSK